MDYNKYLIALAERNDDVTLSITLAKIGAALSASKNESEKEQLVIDTTLSFAKMVADKTKHDTAYDVVSFLSHPNRLNKEKVLYILNLLDKLLGLNND